MWWNRMGVLRRTSYKTSYRIHYNQNMWQKAFFQFCRADIFMYEATCKYVYIYEKIISATYENKQSRRWRAPKGALVSWNVETNFFSKSPLIAIAGKILSAYEMNGKTLIVPLSLSNLSGHINFLQKKRDYVFMCVQKRDVW